MGGVEIRRVTIDHNAKSLFNGLFDVLNPWITKLPDLSSIGQNDMVMLIEKIGFFILGHSLSKLVFSDKTGFQKKIQVVVDGRPAYPEAVVPQPKMEFVHIKMRFDGIDFFQHSYAFRGFPETMKE